MRSWMAVLLAVVLTATTAAAAAQLSPEEQRSLRTRLEERYDIVPVTDGVAFRPKTRIRDVRLIEVSDGSVTVNGAPVTGRELRDRLGADAELILRVSYLTADERRAFVAAGTEAVEKPTEAPRAVAPPAPAPEPTPRRARRSVGDRVRIFGNVAVDADEEVTGQVVAVLGSVRIDGEVGGDAVAVLGTVDLGPKAVAHGNVISVGRRVRRAEGAQVRGGVTEVAFADPDVHVDFPWMGMRGWRPWWIGGFGAFPRLLGSGFRTLLLVLLTWLALVVARAQVERSAERVSDNPVKATLVGLAAEIVIGPVLILTAIVLAITIIGIPLLLLLPFAILVLLLLALVGFSGTAYAVGQWTRRRFGLGGQSAFLDVALGVFVILLPVLLGRVIALVGWPATPVAFLLIATGLVVECIAWASGFGAVLTNAFGHWRATRLNRGLNTPPAGTV
jgi:hypothetical protein